MRMLLSGASGCHTDDSVECQSLHQFGHCARHNLWRLLGNPATPTPLMMARKKKTSPASGIATELHTVHTYRNWFDFNLFEKDAICIRLLSL